MTQSLIKSKKNEEAFIYLDKIQSNFRDISEHSEYSDATKRISIFYKKKIEQEYTRLSN